jgi:hypothetical protein
VPDQFSSDRAGRRRETIGREVVVEPSQEPREWRKLGTMVIGELAGGIVLTVMGIAVVCILFVLLSEVVALFAHHRGNRDVQERFR